MRISREQFFMNQAIEAAKRATCFTAHVGSVLVPKDSTVSIIGFCGSPRKVPHCTDIGCIKLHKHCILTVHSEVNAVLQAASLGITTKDSTLFVTHLPCIRCLSFLVNAKVKNIYYLNFYPYKSNAEKKIFDLIINNSEINIYKFGRFLRMTSYKIIEVLK